MEETFGLYIVLVAPVQKVDKETMTEKLTQESDIPESSPTTPDPVPECTGTCFASPPPLKRKRPCVRPPTYECPKCGADYNKDRSGIRWLGCSGDGCDVWVHVRCLNIDVIDEKAFAMFNYYCDMHMKKK